MPFEQTHASYIDCPLCDVEVPMSGEEKLGEQVFCPYCQVPLLLRKRRKTDELYFEEDF